MKRNDTGDRYLIKGAFDNNDTMWGKDINGIEILSPQKLEELDVNNIKIVVCVKRYGFVYQDGNQLFEGNGNRKDRYRG